MKFFRYMLLNILLFSGLFGADTYYDQTIENISWKDQAKIRLVDNNDSTYSLASRLIGTNGEKIGSIGGALNIHDADVHNVPFNEYFHNHTGIETTLAVANSAGDTSITVTSAVGFSIGDHFQIENGIIETTFPKINNIVGTVFTLDRPLDNAFDIGSTIEEVSYDMNVSGTLANPVAFRLIPDHTQVWHLYRFLWSMTHSTAGDLGLFGNQAALTNGVVLRAYNGTTGQYRTFTNWKANSDMKDDMYDVDFDIRSGGQGTFGTTGRASIKIGSGASPNISGANGDYIEILIQDNLTGLVTYRIKGQGHLETQ